MGLYDNDLGLDAMNRRASSVEIKQQKPGGLSNLMNSPAAKLGRAAAGDPTALIPQDSAAGKAVGMYNTEQSVSNAFKPSGPMGGSTKISDGSKFQGLDNEYSKNMEIA